MRKSISRCTAVAAAVAALVSTGVSAFDLSGAGFVVYGDAQSYALALLNEQAVGSNKAGDPFYVNSTPGAIKDLTVLATGSSGTGVTTNLAGFDSAYPTPSGHSGGDFFSTTQTALDPGQSVPNTVAHDSNTTWDASVSALLSFLNGENMTFFFNNNQINSGATSLQSLAIYAEAWVTDPSGNIVTTADAPTGVFDFTNHASPYNIVTNGGGGCLSTTPGCNVGAYTNTTGVTAPLAGTNTAPPGTDYVLSGGQLCLDSNGALVPQGDPACVKEVNNNLGANQAAYAIIVPELNALLAGLSGDLTNYTMHISLWMGCDPSLDHSTTICTSTPYGRSLNNGFEQLFISTSTRVITVPEPGTLLLLGLGMTGLAFGQYRSRRRAKK